MLSKFFKDNILPNPIIEAWYNASEKTESINDYAAN